MADLRHDRHPPLTASAVVFDDHGAGRGGGWEVLLVHHNKLGQWLYPGGHVTTHAPPYTIIEMDVADAKAGPHHHIDLVYVLRAASGNLSAQLDEVGAAHWVPSLNWARSTHPSRATRPRHRRRAVGQGTLAIRRRLVGIE